MKKKRLSHVQIIALGFFIMIIAGTALLMLPFSSRTEGSAPFLEALFTATSASCVTGLVLCDTALTWTPFGQAVIITLIQIGGLGFMTMAVLFTRLMRKRVGLREKEVTVESINFVSVGGLTELVTKIISGTALIEGIGAVILSVRFIPVFGALKGIWYGIFHSVSAFCNAGFDLMGTYSGEYSSLTAFSGDAVVNITVMLLITLGGIGFIVWDDVVTGKFNFKRYRLHTKLVLTVSAVLTFGGALLFFILEGHNLPIGERVLTSLFDSVTARTAGFNTVDTAGLCGASKLITIMLMFVGGSSGSTAGGAKTTTVALIFLHTVSGIRGDRGTNIFGRKIDDENIKKALQVVTLNLTLALVSAVVISALDGFDIIDVMYETFSAVGTVGMTVGITRDLSLVSKIMIMMLMYLGRVGSISFASAVLEKKAVPPVTYPTEKILVG